MILTPRSKVKITGQTAWPICPNIEAYRPKEHHKIIKLPNFVILFWFLIFWPLTLKVKGKNQRSNISFRGKFWTAWPILTKFTPYNDKKYNYKVKFYDIETKVKSQIQSSNISVRSKSRTNGWTDFVQICTMI